MLQTNFFKTALTSMLVVCAMGFYSCSSDDGGDDGNGPGDKNNIIGKWEVTNPETRAAGDTKYGSFEFTADNKYIITQPATTTDGEKYMLVIFGDYVVGDNESNDFTLNLKEFGTIKISITENHASITIDDVVYVAVKAAEVNLTDNTKKLCGTWNCKSKCEHDTDDEAIKGIITFTMAGTYLSEYPSEEDSNKVEYDNGTWSWKSNDVLSVSYTSYWETLTEVDKNGEIIKPGESWVEHGFDDWKLIKLTDKEFIFEFDDDGDKVTVIGTK